MSERVGLDEIWGVVGLGIGCTMDTLAQFASDGSDITTVCDHKSKSFTTSHLLQPFHSVNELSACLGCEKSCVTGVSKLLGPTPG